MASNGLLTPAALGFRVRRRGRPSVSASICRVAVLGGSPRLLTLSQSSQLWLWCGRQTTEHRDPRVLGSGQTPSLYGDLPAIDHDWEGEKANRAFVLSLGVWVCHSASSRFGVWLTSRHGRAASRSPLSYVDCPGMYWYEFCFRLGILNLVWISVLSVYRTVCLASFLGHIGDAMCE